MLTFIIDLKNNIKNLLKIKLTFLPFIKTKKIDQKLILTGTFNIQNIVKKSLTKYQNMEKNKVNKKFKKVGKKFVKQSKFQNTVKTFF